uniref:Uncharacterized protein n=1 Tax=Fagus sylvatica TaxID=28930 RepID=A0A2N9I677_FAGSY
MTVLRELWYCHVAVLSFHASSSSNPPRFPCAYPFLSDFRGQFWRSSGTQNGSCGISSESSRRPLSNDIKFARIGVRTRELWLPEVGVSELFLCTFPMQISGEFQVPRRSRSHYLSNAPGLADQLVASRKDSAREGGCPCPMRFEFFLKSCPSSRVACRMSDFPSFFGPARTGVFLVRLRAVFPGFRLAPINSWRSNVVLVARARRSTCCESGRLCAQAWQRRWENPGTFSKTLFCRPVFTRVALHRGEFGFARYDLANGGRRNVPYAKGGGQFDPVFGLVNGPVKPWSNLVNLGQTWSNLVKALQTLGDVSQTTFQGFPGTVGPSRVGNGSVKPRSNFGQL